MRAKLISVGVCRLMWVLPLYIESRLFAQGQNLSARNAWDRADGEAIVGFGYAQATDEAWSDYKKATGRTFVRRNNMGDALDFIGWYNHTKISDWGSLRAMPTTLFGLLQRTWRLRSRHMETFFGD